MPTHASVEVADDGTAYLTVWRDDDEEDDQRVLMASHVALAAFLHDALEVLDDA